MKISVRNFICTWALICSIIRSPLTQNLQTPSDTSHCTATQLADKLEQTYTANGRFDQFFQEWNKRSPSKPRSFIQQNDTIQAVYSIFQTVYQPFDLLELGDWEWGNKLNAKCRYVAVQNMVYYAILPLSQWEVLAIDLDWGTLKIDSIEDFRPPVAVNKRKVLYLYEEYAEALHIFLGKQEFPFPTHESTLVPFRTKKESQKRHLTVRTYLPILPGHWTGWHFSSGPHIDIIVFDPTLTKAKVGFRVGYEGGVALLEKKGTTWVIKESKAVWIE